VTSQIWIAIIAASATVIVSIVNAFAALKSQPKQTPATNKPANESQRAGGMVSQLVESAWPLMLALLGNVFVLAWSLRAPVPVDRWVILSIATPVAGIVMCLVGIMLIGMMRVTEGSLRRTLDIVARSIDSDRRIVERIEAADPSVPKPDPPETTPKERKRAP
jgi:hypothetical protein